MPRSRSSTSTASTIALLLGLADGGAIVIQTRPEIRELLELIDKYQPTQFPGELASTMRSIISRTFRSTESIRSGTVFRSAPLPLEVARRFEALTGGSVVEGYGLSETSPATAREPPQRRATRRVDRAPAPEHRPAPGRPRDRLPGARSGRVGELSVRGPQVMLGYFGHPEETAAVLKDGWFRTGDAARIDADGYAYIVDRKKDMVNVGGMKVYPREVEEVLFQHPAVQDVAAIGVPDVGHGEVIKAFVVRKPGTAVTADELIAFVRERIAHYKAPRTVEFRDSLPRSGVQKVLRRVLRDEELAKAAPTAPAK